MSLEKPILTVNLEEDKLYLQFPGWNRKLLDAVREDLICWNLKPRTDYLVADMSILAIWEVKETFPSVFITDKTREDIKLEYDMRLSDIWTGPEMENLYDIQRIPTATLYNRERAILTAAPGLGKTVIALTALSHKYIRLAVIVAPLTSIDSWVKEYEQWYKPIDDVSSPLMVFKVWREAKDVIPLDQDSPNDYIILTTPNVISGLMEMSSAYGEGLASVFWDASDEPSYLILDESFLYQNRKAGRTNVMAELAVNFKNVWMLSGMPVSKVDDDLYAQLNILYPRVFKSYWKFAKRYCLIETDFWGSKIVGNKPMMEHRLRRDLADIIISCEYPSHIPDWEHHTMYCPMTARQEAIYMEAKKDLLVKASTLGSSKPLPIRSVISLTTRLLQIASNPITVGGYDTSGKWDKLLEMLHTEEQPALIWVKYIKTAQQIVKMIDAQDEPWRVAILTGATKPKDRYRLVEQFQTGELDFLVINDAVGKYSLTLTAAKVAYYLERNFDAEAYYQSLYRVRRIISKHSVKIVSMLSTYSNGSPTVDALVHEALAERTANAIRLTIKQLAAKV